MKRKRRIKQKIVKKKQIEIEFSGGKAGDKKKFDFKKELGKELSDEYKTEKQKREEEEQQRLEEERKRLDEEQKKQDKRKKQVLTFVATEKWIDQLGNRLQINS